MAGHDNGFPGGLDLSGFKADDFVTFTLKQGDDGSYIIVGLNGTENTH